MYCTCGAQTVEGAQFCHKCGRPLYDFIPEPEVEEVQPEEPVVAALEKEYAEQPVAPQGPPLSEISFRNAAAVRVGVAVASIGFLFSNLTSFAGSGPFQFFSLILVSMISGGGAVWLYRRRTGEALSVKAGARLGWITGVFSFVLVTIITTFTVTMVGPEKIAEAFKDPAVMRGMPTAQIEQLLSNPLVIGIALLISFCFMFAAYTVSCSVGGALGAKFLNNGDDSL